MQPPPSELAKLFNAHASGNKTVSGGTNEFLRLFTAFAETKKLRRVLKDGKKKETYTLKFYERIVNALAEDDPTERQRKVSGFNDPQKTALKLMVEFLQPSASKSEEAKQEIIRRIKTALDSNKTEPRGQTAAVEVGSPRANPGPVGSQQVDQIVQEFLPWYSPNSSPRPPKLILARVREREPIYSKLLLFIRSEMYFGRPPDTGKDEERNPPLVVECGPFERELPYENEKIKIKACVYRHAEKRLWSYCPVQDIDLGGMSRLHVQFLFRDKSWYLRCPPGPAGRAEVMVHPETNDGKSRVRHDTGWKVLQVNPDKGELVEIREGYFIRIGQMEYVVHSIS